jgi:hypothetical protein
MNPTFYYHVEDEGDGVYGEHEKVWGSHRMYRLLGLE